MNPPRLFRRGASVAAFIQVASMGLGFGAQLLYTNTLSQADYGIFAQVIAMAFVVSNVAVLGVPKAHQQLLPRYRATDEAALAAGWRRAAVRVTAAGSLIACALGIALAVGSGAHPAWLVGVLCIPFMGIALSQQGLALAHTRVFVARFPIEVARPVLAAVAFAVGWAGGHCTAVAATVTWGAASVAIVLGSAWALGPSTQSSSVETRWPQWRSALGSYTGQSAFDLLLQKSDLLLVGWMIGPEAAAVYAIAIGLGKLLNFGLQAVNAILAPLVAELFAQGRTEELQKLLRMGVSASALVGLTTGAALYVGAPWVLSVFGEGYTDGTWVLRIALAGYLFNALSGSCGLLASMSGHPHVTTRAIGMAWVLLALGSAVALPMVGVEGAAAARAFAMAMWNLSLVHWARRKLSLDPSIAGLWRRI